MVRTRVATDDGRESATPNGFADLIRRVGLGSSVSTQGWAEIPQFSMRDLAVI